MKEEIKSEPELRSAFTADNAAGVLAALAAHERGRRFLSQRLDPYRSEFGRKAVWSHEFVYPTWFENPAPIIEAVRGYLETDYDYPVDARGACAPISTARSPSCLRRRRKARRASSCRRRSTCRCGMNPLTPDHHFYIDQGTNARLRLVLIAIGRKLAAAGDDRRRRGRDVPALQRAAGADRRCRSLDARALVGERRDAREASFEIRPPDWVGTATEMRSRSRT